MVLEVVVVVAQQVDVHRSVAAVLERLGEGVEFDLQLGHLRIGVRCGHICGNLILIFRPQFSRKMVSLGSQKCTRSSSGAEGAGPHDGLGVARRTRTHAHL